MGWACGPAPGPGDWPRPELPLPDQPDHRGTRASDIGRGWRRRGESPWRVTVRRGRRVTSRAAARAAGSGQIGPLAETRLGYFWLGSELNLSALRPRLL